MQVTPTKNEIKKFIEVVNALSEFEAQHRMLRNWGIWDEKDLPFPECVKVTNWLKSLIDVPCDTGLQNDQGILFKEIY